MPRQTMSRRTMLRLTAMSAAGAMAAACVAPSAPSSGGSAESAPAAEAVEIIATTSMPVNTFDNALNRAKEKLDGIALEVNANGWGAGGWDGYSDTLLTRIAGGEQIDVIMIAIEGLGLLSAKNVLVPLDEFLAADAPAAEILEKDVHITLREMLQVDGKQMEYPFSWNNMVMYYNTAVFEEEGIAPPSGEWT
jgi:multiple sugar transport system substrate-binding protein